MAVSGFGGPSREESLASRLREDIGDVVRWAAARNPRGLQRVPGPSELGGACDRRLGYRIAGVEEVGSAIDPWPSTVGTAIHSWLEEAFIARERVTGEGRWHTERRVAVDEIISGTSDLYDASTHTVIDHKSVSSDVMRKVIADGPPRAYQVQAHLYGLGYEREGARVEYVALAFYPRAGRLRDLYVWTCPYDESQARGALERVYAIARQLIELDTAGHQRQWESIPATPGDECGLCPWYTSGVTAPSDQGCPGR